MVDWTYDEVVLVCDAVRANAWSGVRANTETGRALSALLRRGKLHPGESLPANFRTVDSIQRKSYDLATASEDYAGRPTKGGKLAGIVIADFKSDPEGMHRRAQVVRDVLEADEVPTFVAAEEPDDVIAAYEGGIVELIARRRERDRGLRLKKLAAVTAAGGSISCEACGFDFEAVYGDRGAGYIEVHHVRPLHVTGPVRTNLDDLALVCANCHRMCHRGKWITPSQLAEAIEAHA